MSIIPSDGNAGLRLRVIFPGSRGETIWAGAIPLRQATTRRTPENSNTNRSTLVGSDRTGVTSALEKNRHVSRGGFDPLFPALFHRNREAFLIARGLRGAQLISLNGVVRYKKPSLLDSLAIQLRACRGWKTQRKEEG